MSRQGEPGGASPLWKKEAGVTNEELGFSYDTTGIDRDQILAAAAVWVDAIEQGMGELPPVLSELPASVGDRGRQPAARPQERPRRVRRVPRDLSHHRQELPQSRCAGAGGLQPACQAL
jgi:hypothetical protein